MSGDPGQAKPLAEQVLAQYGHLIPPIILGLLGAIVRTLMGIREGCSGKRIILELALNSTAAVFCGFVAGWCLEPAEWPQGVKYAVIALSATSGKDLVSQWLNRKWLDVLMQCVVPQKGK